MAGKKCYCENSSELKNPKSPGPFKDLTPVLASHLYYRNARISNKTNEYISLILMKFTWSPNSNISWLISQDYIHPTSELSLKCFYT